MASVHCDTFIFYINILSRALIGISVFWSRSGSISAFLGGSEHERKQWCFSNLMMRVKKMKKKLLIIAIALVIFVVVSSPVSALPTKSPLPPSNPWNLVWGLFQDLQNQIKALQAKDTDLQNQINNIPGPVHLGVRQLVYTKDPVDVYKYEDTALTDGFVTCMVVGDNGEVIIVGGIVVDPNPADPIKDEIVASRGGVGEYSISRTSITMPVNKGDTWYVVWDENTSGVKIYWYPLST